jgi:hypothetical protein
MLHIVGLGGIGKTTLVRKFVEQLTSDESPPDVTFLLSCEGRDFESLLAPLLETDDQQPSGLRTDELIELAVSYLPKDGRSLVVFDGIESRNRPSLDLFHDRSLREGKDVKIVTTSRVHLPYASYSDTLTLTGLNHDDSKHLLELLDISGASDEYRNIVSALDGHPLSLTLAAPLIKLRGSMRSAAELRSHLPLEDIIPKVLRGIDEQLSDEERALAARISLFRDGVTIDDIERLFARSEDGAVSGPLRELGIHETAYARATGASKCCVQNENRRIKSSPSRCAG